MIADVLAAENSGKSPRLFSSRRTLFGIPSALDRELEALSDEAAAKAAAARKKTALSEGGDADNEGSKDQADVADKGRKGDEAGEGRKEAACNAASKDTAGFRKAAKAHRVVHPLEPVFDEHSRVLILGTMPSPKSRETGFYYNHPQNRFWKVLAALFDEPAPQTNEAKRDLVLRHGIALWDVLAECTIEGASDGTIAECVPNDIDWLLGQTPVGAVFCTGAKAKELYDRHCLPTTGIEAVRLPSTSPANAAVSLDQLVEAYRAILPYTLL